MNYLAKFGLKYNPFIKNTNDTKVDLEEYKQLTYRLDKLKESKGLGIITGGAGVGKTSTIRYWTKTLNESLYKIVYIQLSTLTVNEFYKELAYNFGLAVEATKRKNFINIQDEIKRLVFEKNVTPVIIIDEANYILSQTLNDFKMLLNFEMDSKDRVILLLVGQTNLKNILNLQSHEALRQRISMNYTIRNLAIDESRFYIDSKLNSAGLLTPLISNEAYNQIINTANGVIRKINQIMNASLSLLANQQADLIDEKIALDAINEVQL